MAYALSPIDLIPDFIPILGYLDDLVVLPIGIYLAIKLIPPNLWKEFQGQALKDHGNLSSSRNAAFIIAAIWCLGLSAIAYTVWIMAH